MSTEKKSMMDKILEKVDVIAGPMTKFGQIPFVRGIVNGMVAALPVTMVGSLFLVVYLFCSDGGLTTHALIPFLKPWAGDLALVNSLSMGIMAVYIIIAFGAEYAEIKGFSKTTGAVGAFFAFMLLNYNSVGQLVVTAKDGTLSAGASAFESTYWGGAGLITAMIAGAIAINIIDICYKKHIVIKLPDSVPPAISDSFSAIIPYFFITLVCWGIRTLAGLNIPELVGQMLLPVLGAADNIFVYTLQQFLSALLWICGLHGDNITGAFTYWLTSIGFVGKMYMNLPWATPSPILGYLAAGGSIGGAVIVFINFAIGMVIFYPFWKSYEKAEVAKMNGEAA